MSDKPDGISWREYVDAAPTYQEAKRRNAEMEASAEYRQDAQAAEEWVDRITGPFLDALRRAAGDLDARIAEHTDDEPER